MDDLIERAANAVGPDARLEHDIWMLVGRANVRGWRTKRRAPPYTASLDAARAFTEAILPGWTWRVATCSVSDDAWVCPDFNHPKYGAEFKEKFGDAFDGRDPAEAIYEATDVDRRPPGQPALALVQAALIGLRLSRDVEARLTPTP